MKKNFSDESMPWFTKFQRKSIISFIKSSIQERHGEFIIYFSYARTIAKNCTVLYRTFSLQKTEAEGI